MKEEIKTPEKELNKVQMSSLSVAEFRTLVIRMLKELSEDFNCTQKNQTEIKDRLMEMNNLQGINSRVAGAENQISDMEHRKEKTTKQKKKKKKKK